MKELTFKFTLDETNLILEGLGSLPVKTVFALVNKIQQQASDQINQTGKTQEATAEKPPAIEDGKADS